MTKEFISSFIYYREEVANYVSIYYALHAFVCYFLDNQDGHFYFLKLTYYSMAIEKIVVVDDEMMIRKALETQLRNIVSGFI